MLIPYDQSIIKEIKAKSFVVKIKVMETPFALCGGYNDYDLNHKRLKNINPLKYLETNILDLRLPFNCVAYVYISYISITLKVGDLSALFSNGIGKERLPTCDDILDHDSVYFYTVLALKIKTMKPFEVKRKYNCQGCK